ncbi:hypothetical protein Nepgr_015364 [Nepenthes gracilis]|uniref:Uncharacterized protein n=1 Tax=Nepenthes gracilis TaxID=150966 RepID=A0AAD3SLK7_NEPGR|nr:hypothetical protein Nepgr_015364 [Nepenthes gracilis]
MAGKRAIEQVVHKVWIADAEILHPGKDEQTCEIEALLRHIQCSVLQHSNSPPTQGTCKKPLHNGTAECVNKAKRRELF